MPTKAELLALADEVEALAEPCREVDRRLALAIGDGRAGRFTESLDSAMTLAGNYLLASMSEILGYGLPGAIICSDTSTNPPKEHAGIGCGQDRIGALARALTAAALRARAEEMK